MQGRFTEEELAIAKRVDLVDVCIKLGYTVKRIGRYHTLSEMDSIRIYDRTSWFRWSRRGEKGESGGSQIDFLRVFCGMSVKEAVFWLLDFAGYSKEKYTEDKLVVFKKESNKMISDRKDIKRMDLPIKSESNYYLYSYLEEKRKISREVIDIFIDKGLIYESKHYHNIVFKGNDKDGITRFASMRGVFDCEGRMFKCDVKGNDKNYGFNIVNESSNTVVVFEAAIDLMSYMELMSDYTTNKLALGMLHDAPLQTFLKEHPDINAIILCLDNDGQGKVATQVIGQKYKKLGYKVDEVNIPARYKDINGWLVDIKKYSKKYEDCRNITDKNDRGEEVKRGR